jgi:hypothetical protein
VGRRRCVTLFEAAGLIHEWSAARRARTPLGLAGPGGNAAKSGVSIATIKRLEAQDGPIGGRLDTVRKIVSATVKTPISLTGLDAFRPAGFDVKRT